MLDTGQMATFANDGLLMLPWRLKASHVDQLLLRLPDLTHRAEALAFEADGHTTRAVHGGHENSAVFSDLPRLPTLLEPAQQILGGRVYVYQFKVNMKCAFAGDVWPWHQDYSFWAKEDGMPAPRAINVAIFLDHVTEFNGPIYFIPGSHQGGCLDAEEQPPGHDADAAWHNHVAASLSHQTDRNRVREIATSHGMVAPKGPRGSILFFDCNLVHASPPNISPFERRLLFITYNSVDNVPTDVRRPDFLVCRNTRPLDVLRVEDGSMVEPALT